MATAFSRLKASMSCLGDFNSLPSRLWPPPASPLLQVIHSSQCGQSNLLKNKQTSKSTCVSLLFKTLNKFMSPKHDIRSCEIHFFPLFLPSLPCSQVPFPIMLLICSNLNCCVLWTHHVLHTLLALCTLARMLLPKYSHLFIFQSQVRCEPYSESALLFAT